MCIQSLYEGANEIYLIILAAGRPKKAKKESSEDEKDESDEDEPLNKKGKASFPTVSERRHGTISDFFRVFRLER